MAKINYIKINGTIRYLETIAYLSTLPAATSDSADLVSVNNKIYVKNQTTTQGVSGVWQFKDRLTTDLTVAKNITFTTTSDRATIYTQIRGGTTDMWYNDTYVYDSADWINANYKTIIIIGGADIEDSELESFLRTNATYLGRAFYYTELTAASSGGGIEIIDINGVATLPSDYQSIATLETAYLLKNDLFYKLESEDTDYLYFTNNYELAYNRISVNKNDWSITQAETINVDRVFGVEITDVPSAATNGTLTEIQLATLQASDSNYIMFNNEKYYLNDKGHTEGYLTYSHVGAQSDEIYLKTITITISTRAWVLLEQKAGGLTTDTAYVENSTLYISEGTTAASSGTSENNLVVKVAVATNTETNTNELQVWFADNAPDLATQIANVGEQNLTPTTSEIIFEDFLETSFSSNPDIDLIGLSNGNYDNLIIKCVYLLESSGEEFVVLDLKMPKICDARPNLLSTRVVKYSYLQNSITSPINDKTCIKQLQVTMSFDIENEMVLIDILSIKLAGVWAS